MMNDRIGLQVRASAGPGVLHQLTGAIAQLRGDISSVEISSQGPTEDLVNFEIDLPGSVDQLVRALQDLPVVRGVEVVDTLKTIYGKRIIIMGGGAQVGQVAIGAISEADRHNIRGERISVDTIPLVGEEHIAAAVRAVPDLPRADSRSARTTAASPLRRSANPQMPWSRSPVSVLHWAQASPDISASPPPPDPAWH